MFETNISAEMMAERLSRDPFLPGSRLGRDDSESVGSDGNLHRMDWPELVARLTAMRDARAALHPRKALVTASFERGAAKFLASRVDDMGNDCENERKQPVNPIGLGHGKPKRGKPVVAVSIAADGHRETL